MNRKARILIIISIIAIILGGGLFVIGFAMNDWNFIGLDKSTALDAINYDIYGKASVEFAKVQPKIVYDKNGVVKQELISYNDTPCFAENRYNLNKGEVVLNYAPSVYVITQGQGELVGDNYSKTIKKGDYFFLPRVAEGKFKVKTDKKIEIIECLPSKQN
jgi:mannose-6-phosphate isomerase